MFVKIIYVLEYHFLFTGERNQFTHDEEIIRRDFSQMYIPILILFFYQVQEQNKR